MHKSLSRLSLFLLVIGFLLPTGTASGFSPDPIAKIETSSSLVKEVGSGNHGRPPPERKNETRRGKENPKTKAILERFHKLELYQRGDYKKFMKDIRDSKPSDCTNFKYIREGIIAHEAGLVKGHTLEKHVGLSDKGLMDRYQKEKVVEGKKSSSFSTFKDFKSAEHYIEKTIEAHMKTPEGRKEMKDFLQGPHNEKLEWKHTFSETAGRKYNGHLKEFSDVRGVQISLLRNERMPNGYQIVTAFPIE